MGLCRESHRKSCKPHLDLSPQSQSTALPTSPHILTERLWSLKALHPLVTLARHSVAVAAAIAVLLSGVGALRAQCAGPAQLGSTGLRHENSL